MPLSRQQNRQADSGGPRPTLDPMTLRRLREAIGDLKPILRTVLQELPARCTSLRLAFDAGNRVQVDKTSHFIAGSVANLGATRLTSLAKELEKIAKDGDLNSASGTLERLEEEVERVTIALTALLATDQRYPRGAETSR